jgi:hypothetical protein
MADELSGGGRGPASCSYAANTLTGWLAATRSTKLIRRLLVWHRPLEA